MAISGGEIEQQWRKGSRVNPACRVSLDIVAVSAEGETPVLND